MTPNTDSMARSGSKTPAANGLNQLAALLIAILATWVAHAAGAATFHVATTGNDAQPGTQDQPFASVERALDAARAAPGPDQILVRRGTYYLTRTLELDPRDSGLIIEGDGGPVVLSGGRRVTGWKPWKGNVQQADLSGLDLPDLDFRQLDAYAGRPANLYALNGFQDDFVTFRSNLIFPRNGQIAMQGGGDLPRQDPWQAWQQRGQDQDSRLADPQFVDAARRNYQLQPNSPALSLGFQPIDLSAVGNYASPDRRTWPRPEMPVVRDAADYTPLASGARQPERRDYENYAVGEPGGTLQRPVVVGLFGRFVWEGDLHYGARRSQ